MRMSACSSDVCSSDLWLAVSFLGMLAIVSAHGEQGQGGGDYLTGIALALGAALLYAIAALIIKRLSGTPPQLNALIQVSRSEESSVGKECVSTGRSRWSRYHKKKKK